jgi:hypothetical protein
MAEENGNGKRFKAPKWALALAILIPSISSAGAAWYSLIAGDQDAHKKSDKTWKTLSDAYRKLHLTVVHMQGQAEGYNNAKLMKQIEALQNEVKTLRGGKVATTGAPKVEVLTGPKVAERKLKPCPPAWVRIKGKCTKSRQAIAKAVDDARAKAADNQRKLDKERRWRKVLEAKKAKLQWQMKVQRALPSPKPPPMLPEDLDEASKKAGK